jgi:hypothetical protein
LLYKYYKNEIMHSPNRTINSIPYIVVEGLTEAKKRLSEFLPTGAFFVYNSVGQRLNVGGMA